MQATSAARSRSRLAACWVSAATLLFSCALSDADAASCSRRLPTSADARDSSSTVVPSSACAWPGAEADTTAKPSHANAGLVVCNYPRLGRRLLQTGGQQNGYL